MHLAAQAPDSNDHVASAIGMALFALCTGYAIHINNGNYDRQALLWLTISLGIGFSTLLIPRSWQPKWLSSRTMALVLLAGIVIETVLLLVRIRLEWLPTQAVIAIVVVSLLGLVQFLDLRKFRIPVAVFGVAAFLYAGSFVITALPGPQDDVYVWQQSTSLALESGQNPYEVRILSPFGPNGPNSLYYPIGMVDRNGYVTCALPYPPLSLLMALPGFIFGDDIRYAQLFAIGASALLMALVRPARRWAALAATLFLLTPRVFYTLWQAWTEPLMVVAFSLLMFCACRWRKGVPWALGLFLCTKQYSVLALPLIPLLVEGPDRWKQLRSMLVKAGIVVAAINLPFYLWNAGEFTRAVILLRVVPPFRADSLSYLSWLYSLTGTKPAPWIALLFIVPALGLILWRETYSPAGFAAGMTLLSALFFAFGKQAFCNYYYFTIATACWAVAAADLPLPFRSQPSNAAPADRLASVSGPG